MSKRYVLQSFFNCFIICMILLVCSDSVYAFDHGYKRRTEEIYAAARYDLAIYEDRSSGNLQTMLPAFKKVVVIGETENWYEVKYYEKSSANYGWVTKDDFHSDCLEYDGADKQVMANGKYKITYHNNDAMESSIYETDGVQDNAITEGNNLIINSWTFRITYVGDNKFRIKNSETDLYLLPDALFTTESERDLWGSEEDAGSFYLTRKNKYYGIQDGTTNRYLGIDENGLLCFSKHKDYSWRFNRTKKAISKEVMRVFAQFDPDWGKTYYGKGTNDNPSENNFCTSACGIFSTMNCIYAVTGQKVNPYRLADYAVEKYYRIQGCGTDSGFFKAAAEKFGEKYGFKYDGSTGSIEEVRQKLKEGDCCIVYLPHHYACIASYNEKTKKYLLLDSHYLPKRATCPYGDWVTQEDLESGSLYAQMFFFYKRIDY